MTTIDMNDSHAREYQQVVFTKAHLKLCAAGLTPPRGLTKARLMTHARSLTGANFGPRAYQEAIDALEKRKQALLVYISNDG